MFAAMAVAFVFALTIPKAFVDDPQGLPGPLLIVGCYAAIRILHLTLLWLSTAGNPELRWRNLSVAPPMIIAVALLLGAAIIPPRLADGHQAAVRIALWIAAALVEYGWLLRLHLWNWAVFPVRHWVERFELIIIIALGESIISVGIGSNLIGRSIAWPAVVGAILTIIVTAALWWGYFDHVSPRVFEMMEATHGPIRVRLARDGYMYLHLAIMAGVILFSLGGEVTLSHLGGNNVDLTAPFPGPGETVTYSGVILFFLGAVLFQLRILGTLAWPRVITAVALAALLPVIHRLPAAASLTILPAVCVGVIFLEIAFLGEWQIFVQPPDVRKRLMEMESNEDSGG